MSYRLVALLVGSTAVPLAAQQAAPTQDVWLAPLNVKDGIVTIGDPINVSNRPGYDNQPSFSRDGRRLYFTTEQRGQTDIMRYDIRKREVVAETATPESEYSAAQIPGSNDLAVVVVERDSTQRLWRIGSARTVLAPTLTKVGYHAWADDRQLITYVLGNEAKGEANALVLVDLRSGRLDTLARGVGRGLARHPLSGVLTFSVRPADAPYMRVRQYDPATRQVSDLTTGLPGRGQDYAWSPGGRLFMAEGTTIVQKPVDGAWSPVIALRDPRIGDISRIAISPKGDWIAFAANETTVSPPIRKEWTDVAIPLDSTFRPTKRVDELVPAAATTDTAPRTVKPYTDIAVPVDASGKPIVTPSRDVPPRPAADRSTLAVTTAPAATLTVIVVRHAEKAPGTGDVPLSELGLQRARALADALEDASVRAVFTSTAARTRQTAEPLATAAGLPLQPISLDGGVEAHARRTAEAVLKTGGGAVLVVGHSNTVTAILAALGAPRMPDLCDAIYDRLFVLTVPPTGPRPLVGASYGVATPPNATCAAMTR